MRMVRPGAATSTAASIPSGTRSTADTSSTTGIAPRQAVDDEHRVVAVQHGRHDVDAALAGLVEQVRDVVEVRAGPDHDDDRDLLLDAGEVVEGHRHPDPETVTARGVRVVPDHRRLGDDRLGDRLHREAADHRRGLVEQDGRELTRGPPGGLEGPPDGRDGTGRVVRGALDPRRPGQRGRRVCRPSPSSTSAMHASVVELPMSTPMTSDTRSVHPRDDRFDAPPPRGSGRCTRTP